MAMALPVVKEVLVIQAIPAPLDVRIWPLVPIPPFATIEFTITEVALIVVLIVALPVDIVVAFTAT